MDSNIARATFSMNDNRKIEKSRAALSRLEGILSVGFNVLSQMVYVEYNPRVISIEKIRAELRHSR